jgi:predicted nuclease with TOPRIM domain
MDGGFWGGTLDPNHVVGSYSAAFLYHGLTNQQKTLDNAKISAGIKERHRKPFLKRAQVISKEIEGFQKKLLKGETKLSDAEKKKLREEVNSRTKELEGLQQQIREAGNADHTVVKLKQQNNMLNKGTHTAANSLTTFNPTLASWLRTYVEESDKTSADIESSGSALTSFSTTDYFRTFGAAFRNL